MSVRKHPSRQGWWVIDIYPQGRKGKRQIIPVEGTEAKAREVEHDLRRRFKNEFAATTYPKIAEVVPDFVAAYRLDHQPRGTERTVLSLKTILPFFGPYQFTSLAPALIEQYKSKRLEDGVSQSTINKELCALSSLCKWAVERGYCNQLPFSIKKFPAKLTKAPLPVVPTQEEVQAILNAAMPEMRGIYAALYYGGLRTSEALNMRAEDIFWERGLFVVRGKGNKQRIVPILPPLEPFLRERFEAIGGKGHLWVNPETGKPYQELKKGLKGSAKRAGVTKNIYPHILRHSFGTHATESGVGLRTLQEVMGHSSPQVTQIYTTLAAQHLVNDMKKFTTVAHGDGGK